MRFAGPVDGLVVHHSVTAITADPVADAQTVENVIYQRRFKSRFSMVAYSYLLHPDGTVFVGRGSAQRNGANRNQKGGPLNNSNTVSVCLIGDYRVDVVTDEQRRAFDGLVDELLHAGVLAKRNTVAHSTLAYTLCPAAGFEQLEITPVEDDDGDDEMVTCYDKLTGEAWVVADGKARPISDVDQWLATYEGPVRRANNMASVVADLYVIV